MFTWIRNRIARSKIQLVIRADYDLQKTLTRLQHETGADSMAHVIECSLHALDRMVDERNRGGTPAFIQSDMGLVSFTPEYLYGQDPNDPSI